MSRVQSTTVEVCVFMMEEDGIRYLLLRRSAANRVYPGIWQYVTGSVEPDETAVAAARRELAEETSLETTGFWVVPFVHSYYDPSADSVNMIPLFAAQVRPGSHPGLSAEHDAFEWCTYGEARARLVWPGQKEGLRLVHDCILGGEESGRLTRLH